MDSVNTEAKENDKGGGGDANQVAETGPSHPLDLLSEDVWLHVLSFLDANPRDLLNVGETCSYFEELLENQMPGGRGAGRAACRLEEVLPLIIQYAQEEADILALRQVCRRVGETTDKVLECRDQVTPSQNQGFFQWLVPLPPRDLERHESFEWTHFQKYSLEYQDRGRWLWPRVKFATGPTSKPLELFQNHEVLLAANRLARGKEHRPFKMVSKKIFANCPYDFPEPPGPDVPDHATFLLRLLEFLETCKSEDIRSVDIHVYEATPVDYYFLVHQVVGTVPLLRSLGIPSTLPIDVAESIFSGEGVQGLQQFIDGHPLPVAPNLTKLEFFCYPPFLRQLSIAYGGHLKILQIKVTDPSLFLDRGNIKKETADYQFPVLEYLSVGLCQHSLPILNRFGCPRLMSLKIDTTTTRRGGRAMEPLVELFEGISSFPSVSSLYLWLHLTLPESTGRESEWELRNVRKLVVYTCMGSFRTMPSLRCYAHLFPNVEEISVFDTVPFRFNGRVNLVDGDLLLFQNGRLRESTIWRDAPHLQVVSQATKGGYGVPETAYKCYRPQD